ncbi:MAG: phage head morphogenesis protein [Pyrinomonadaceae bacterium]|jgi:SPP1 gp7 family putative phage head morphogenesis protein|nr:phage head morphogenesis protein [Pyrinomonadaceae bacterium]
MSAIDELLKKHRQAIIDREESTFRQIIEAYQLIEKELQNEFKKLQSKIQTARDNGDEISIGWILRQNSLKEFIDSVKNIITEFGSQITPKLIREQTNAVNSAIENTTELINSIAQSPSLRVAASFSQRVIENAVGLMGDGSPILDYYKEQLAPMVAEKIRQEVIKGVAVGTNFNTIARRLTQTGDITRQRALSLARTEVNRVRLLTNLEIYRTNGITKYKRICSFSSRTCILCLILDGKIYSVNETMPKHINCRCVSVPILERFDYKRKTGLEWFLEQPEETQKQILGNNYFEIWKEKQFDLIELVKYRHHKTFGKSVYKKTLAEILMES